MSLIESKITGVIKHYKKDLISYPMNRTMKCATQGTMPNEQKPVSSTKKPVTSTSNYFPNFPTNKCFGIVFSSNFLQLCSQNFQYTNMGLFNFFTQEIAIDLGTANTLIIHNEEVVVNEPSIVALDRNNPKNVLAVGRKALLMHEKTHESIRTVRPLKDGVIADFNAAEIMIREMIKMIYPKKPLFPPKWRMMICIPSSITEVEKRAVRDSAEQAGAQEVYLLHEPMAAALGIGIDVEEPVGNMIIDIGGGTTGITVIALAGIVCDQSIRIAGDEFTGDIMEALRRYHSLLIGERTAEQIKIQIGAAMKDLDNPPDDIPVNGRDLVTGIPKQIMVSYQEVAEALDKSIFKIEEAILKALEQTPPELAADIYRRGLYLTGGGALLRGLDKRLSQKIKLPVHVADDPLKSVVRGTGIALKNYDRYPFVMR